MTLAAYFWWIPILVAIALVVASLGGLALVVSVLDSLHRRWTRGDRRRPRFG